MAKKFKPGQVVRIIKDHYRGGIPRGGRAGVMGVIAEARRQTSIEGQVTVVFFESPILGPTVENINEDDLELV